MNSDLSQKSDHAIEFSPARPVLHLDKNEVKNSPRVIKRRHTMTSYSEATRNSTATPAIKQVSSTAVPKLSPHSGFITSRLGSITPPFKSSATSDLLFSEPIAVISRENKGGASPLISASIDRSASKNQVSQSNNHIQGGSFTSPTSALASPQFEKKGWGFMQSVSTSLCTLSLRKILFHIYSIISDIWKKPC